MSLRRKSRELALQLLYNRSLNASLKSQVKGAAAEVAPDVTFSDFIRDFNVSPEVADYGRKVFLGICGNSAEIDRVIEENSRHWKLSRMSLVDASILRIACFELAFSDREVPPHAVLNEAIELAKDFGTSDSAAFVNGVLDPIARKH